MTYYQCIAIDPPWPENGGGKSKRGADRHYSTVKVKDMLATVAESQWKQQRHHLVSDKVWRPDPEGCHVWVWVTGNYLQDGLQLMKHLGVRYINHQSWAKMRPACDLTDLCVRSLAQDLSTSKSAAERKQSQELRAELSAGLYRPEPFGLGQYIRGAHESVLFGMFHKKKGGSRPPAVRNISSLILAARREHSQKPDIFYDQARAIAGPDASCLEMFGRSPRRGWDVWGDECESRQEVAPVQQDLP